MKLFIDSANLGEIREVNQLGLLGGVTTNPTLIVKEIESSNRGDGQTGILKNICAAAEVDVMAEPISTELNGIINESLELSKISKNIVAKIPITADGILAVRELKKRGIKTAFTLVFSPSQALIAALAGADYICPFVGRLDDAGQNGMDLIRDALKIYQNYAIKTKVVVASVRNMEHIITSALMGAYAVTAPFKIISQELFKHQLTDKGIEKFLSDWKKISKNK